MEILNNKILDINNKGTRRTGERGKNCVLNGTDQVIKVLDNTSLDITDNLTICLWAKNDNATLSADEILVSKYNAATNTKEWRISYTASEKIRISLGDPSDGSVAWYGDSNSGITINTYNFIAITFESGTLKLYVNGIEVAYTGISGVIPSTLYNGSEDLLIGSGISSTTFQEFFDGNIMDVRIYKGDSTVLTAEQINNIYKFPAKYISFYQQQLKAHYKLDESSGISVFDSSGNGNTGEIINAASNWGINDLFSFQNQLGYNKRMYFDGVDDFVEFNVPAFSQGKITATLTVPSGAGTFTLFSDYDNANKFIGIAENGNATANVVGATGVIKVDGVTVTTRGDLYTAIVGKTTSIEITNVSLINWNNFAVGAYTFYAGLNDPYYIYDLSFDLTNDGTTDNSYKGYGNTDADWIDQTGSNNGTVNGSPSNIYLPRNESNRRKDVFGNDLTYTGKRPNDAELINSNCLTLDGIDDYISAPHLIGSETVVSSSGTSTPSISAGRIDFSAGTCWNLLLSDGTHYPLSEGGGLGIHDDSGSENHGVLTNVTIANVWGSKQNEYHNNLKSGFVWTYQDAVQVYTGEHTANISKLSFKFRSTDNILCVFNNGSSLSNPYLFLIVDGSSSNIHVTAGNGTPVISIDGSTSWGTTRDQLHTALCDGEVHEVSITGLSFIGDFVTNGIYVNSYTYSSTYLWDSTTYIWDLEATDINDNVIPVFNQPNVRIPAVNSTTGSYSIPLTDIAGDYFNRCETQINFNPDSTPEMIQLGAYSVPNNYSFGNLIDYTYEQAFKRNLDYIKEDRFLFFKNQITGSSLNEIKEYADFTFNGDFVSVWDTTNSGSSNSKQITLPLVSAGTYNMTVDWGDGYNSSITSYSDPSITHTYSNEGRYLIKISGTCQGWQFDNLGDKEKILFVNNWGVLDISTDASFYGCINLNSNAIDSPTVSTTSLRDCFRDCTSLVKGLSGWTVGSNVTNMSYLFDNATLFNDDISTWNTSNVTNMFECFRDAISFNQDIGTWNVSNVSNMYGMFRGASSFNQNIGSGSNWVTTNLSDVRYMFRDAISFNQNIGTWDTSNVTGMDYMFRGASSFNQDIGSWDVSLVEDMYQMFNSATSFDQDLGSWNITSCLDLDLMFVGCTLSTSNYDSLLIGWESLAVQNNITFHGGNSTYTSGSAAATARANLIADHSWIITDGGAI